MLEAFLVFFFGVSICCCGQYVSESEVYTGSWVIEVKGGIEKAKLVARELDLEFNGPLGSLQNLYHVQHKLYKRRLRRHTEDIHKRLEAHVHVSFAEQQKLLRRKRRGYFLDPLYRHQWYIENQDLHKGGCSLDMNITSVWKQNITGRGAVVTVVDDGVDYRHPDLKKNYDAKASYDYNSHDSDPLPRYDFSLINKHGTRCAGEVAAQAGNSVCGVGVAYDAKVGGIRMLDGDVTDAVEAGSLSYNPNHIDIYTNSWGPDDDGRTVDGPARLAIRAFEQGVKNGRNGLGSIFIWATGNGGRKGDYCSCDGYINRIETIGIGAVDYCGNIPYYAEPCPGTLAVTYSSGNRNDKKVATTDLHNRCTMEHTGTSAASPLAAGILALVLQANPNVTWRDVQHLIVRTSEVPKKHDKSLVTNGVGYKVSTHFGYGVLNAGKLVSLARDWETVGEHRTCTSNELILNKIIFSQRAHESVINSTACKEDSSNEICKLEHVHVVISIDSYPRGGLEITLTSPSGTVSPILKQRRRDTGKWFNNWVFLSVYFWDETPYGSWKLKVTQKKNSGATHILKKWKLIFYGTGCRDKQSGINATTPSTWNNVTKNNETVNGAGVQSISTTKVTNTTKVRNATSNTTHLKNDLHSTSSQTTETTKITLTSTIAESAPKTTTKAAKTSTRIGTSKPTNNPTNKPSTLLSTKTTPKTESTINVLPTNNISSTTTATTTTSILSTTNPLPKITKSTEHITTRKPKSSLKPETSLKPKTSTRHHISTTSKQTINLSDNDSNTSNGNDSSKKVNVLTGILLVVAIAILVLGVLYFTVWRKKIRLFRRDITMLESTSNETVTSLLNDEEA